MSPAPEKPIILIGPTAVGKTAVSIPLAQTIDAEIVSADSRQVYIGLDIGTAKPTRAERTLVRHHLLDVVTIDCEFTVADFQRLAFEALEDIASRGKRALVVGGTGLYVRALVDRPSYQNQPPVQELRERIRQEISEKGALAVYEELERLDPDAAGRIHPHNLPRLVRALEVIRATGRKFSEVWETDRKMRSQASWRIVCLNTDREVLYRRINLRVLEMIRQGWLDEVRELIAGGATGDEKPLRGLGYRDIVRHLKGEMDIDNAIERIQRDTRRFAKRQLTFFRMIDGVRWLDVAEEFDPSEVANRVLALVESENSQ